MSNSTLTRQNLIDSIYGKTGIDPFAVKRIVELTLDGIKEALASGGRVELRGFGTFEVRKRKGRAKARNPFSGEMVSVEPHGVPYWKPGKEIRQEVWNLENQD